jgi:hypothetical protein
MTFSLKVVILNHNQKQSADILFDRFQGLCDVALFDSGSSPDQVSEKTTHRLPNLFWTGCWNKAWELFADYDVIWCIGGDCELLSEPSAYVEAIQSAYPFGTWSSVIRGTAHDYMKAELAEGHVYSVQYLEGMAFAISRQLWQKVGPFDAENYIGHGLDLYCCYISRQDKLKNILDGRVEMMHPPSEQYDHTDAVNLMLQFFRRRFGDDWSDTINWWLGRTISFKTNAISRIIVQRGQKRYVRPFLRT